MTALTRGPLPASVYWRRRAVILLIAVTLVFGFARLLGSGGGGDPKAEQVEQVAAETTPSETAPVEGAPSDTTPSDTTAGTPPRKARKKAARAAQQSPSSTPTSTPTPTLAEPQGACAPEDVTVTPRVERANSGRATSIMLDLQTTVSEACTWQLAPENLTLKVTSGKDEIWTTRHCPESIPQHEVVVRNTAATEVELRWNSRRSNADCSKRTDWAKPGWYHVTAAALPGEPRDVQFEMGPAVSRATPAAAQQPAAQQPTAQATKKPGRKPRQKSNAQQSTSPTATPSGAVEPDDPR